MSNVAKIIADVVIFVGVTVATGNPELGALAVVATNTAIGLLTPSPAQPLQGDPTLWQGDPFAGVPYVMGRTLVGGKIVYRATHGNNNVNETFVTILSGAGPIQSIDAYFYNRTTVSYDGTGNASGPYHNQIYGTAQLGHTPESTALLPPFGNPSSWSSINFAEAPPGWTSASKLSGYAATLVQMNYQANANPPFTSEPQAACIVHGVKAYDPRQDSTYPGGSGSQRALVETTYAWTDNPMIHALTYALGRYHNGKRVHGIGWPITAIDVAAFVSAANVCDANGWKIGGEINSRPETPWANLKVIMQAGGAEPKLIGGMLSCVINTPRVSVATITDSDLVGDCSLAATQPRRSRINGVYPRYRSEALDWQMVVADQIIVDSYVTEDGDERVKPITYSLVQDVNQVAQLARYDIENAREYGPVAVTVGPKWMNNRVGDCVTLQISDNGVAINQKMVILAREIDPSTCRVTFKLRSETDGKHTYALGQTGVAPPTPTLSSYVAASTAPASGSWVASATLLGSDSGSVPAIQITGAVDTSLATLIIFEYRLTGTSAWTLAASAPPQSTGTTISSLAPGGEYDVAVSYVIGGLTGDRIILGPVTVGSLAAMTAQTAIKSQYYLFGKFDGA